MAEEKEKPAEEGAEKKDAPKKKLPILMILAAMQVLVVLGAGSVFVKIAFFEKRPDFSHKNLKERAIASVYDDSQKVETLDLKEFSVNLPNNHILKANIKLEVSDKMTVSAIQKRLPAIQAHVIEILSARTEEQTATFQGKLQLKDALRDAINKLISEEGSHPGIVREVYFVDFILI